MKKRDAGDIESVCIADFGVAATLEATARASSLVGTPAYMAPEILSSHGKGYNAFKADSTLSSL